MRRWLALVVAGCVVACGSPTPSLRVADGDGVHVNRHDPQCQDVEAAGTEAQPYCTVRYAATPALRQPGDIILIHAGRYGEGPIGISKSGTQAAPITWKGVGGTVVLGHFLDLDDATATPVDGMPGVYAIPYTPLAGKTSAGIFQTYFDPIRVADDSNPTVFTMLDTDGPLRLKGVTTNADLVHPGTVRYDAGRYLIHPYTNRVPSATATDFVLSFSGGETTASWNVFEDLTVTYAGAYNALTSKGNDNVLRRIRYEGLPFIVQGNRLQSADVFVSHVIDMGERFTFYHSGGGTAVIVYGSGHSLRRTTAIHSWNASVQLERASKTLVDGVITHGSPNHCGVGTVAATGTDNVFRNILSWNCQDHTYWATSQSDPIGAFVLEHLTVVGGVYFESRDGAPVVGPIRISNSVFGGDVNFGWKTATYDPAMCQYEAATVIEHSVITSTAKIHRCDDGRDYPLGDYLARCERGEFTGCITFRNNQVIEPSQWTAVVKEWPAPGSDTWDATLVEGSPAIGLARAGATQDVRGMTRPQGDQADAGAYEWPLGLCEVSDWTAWQAGPWTEHGVSTRTRDESRTRTVTRPGENCPPLAETRTTTEACTALATTLPSPGGFEVTCTAWVPRDTVVRRGSSPPAAPPPEPAAVYEREPTGPPEARPPTTIR